MIIVFGATGFIGTYLLDRLISEGKNVLACDISEIGEAYCEARGIPYKRVDVTEKADFAGLPVDGIEAVVLLACVQPANVSERQYDPVDFIRVNVIGTLNVLDFCLRNRVPKVVYTCSHRNTQGMWASKSGTPIKESDGRAIKFTGEYAMFSISESAAADCVEHYCQAYGIEGVTLRLPPVYGYGPHTEIFKDGKPLKTGFQVFIERAEQGAPITLWGDPENGRDIVYVKDVVAAIDHALAKPGVAGLYNIASGRCLSLRQQAEAIIRVYSPPGKPSEIRFQPEVENLIENYAYDIEKAKTVLGWEPKYTFEEMLIDYRTEMESRRFEFLLEKRRSQIQAALRAETQ